MWCSQIIWCKTHQKPLLGVIWQIRSQLTSLYHLVSYIWGLTKFLVKESSFKVSINFAYLRINVDKISVLNWNPTSYKASRKRSALSIPAFSLVCILKTLCHVFRFTMNILKSLKFIRARCVFCVERRRYLGFRFGKFKKPLITYIHQTNHLSTNINAGTWSDIVIWQTRFQEFL